MISGAPEHRGATERAEPLPGRSSGDPQRISPPRPGTSGAWLDTALSALLPGLGQLRQGNVPRAIALACSALGLWGAVLLSLFGPAAVRSVLTAVLLALLYPFLWLPAVLDAWRGGTGAPAGAVSPDRAWYVVVSLLAVGPMALPLLWQSEVFSRRGKLVWTAVVVAIAVMGLLFILVLGPIVEGLLQEVFELLAE